MTTLSGTISDVRNGPQSRPRSAAATLLQRLAPFLAMAVLAYPTLVWPLLEATAVSLEPVYGVPPVDGPPSALLRIYFSTLLALGLAALVASSGISRPGPARPALIGLAGYLAWAGITGFWAVEPEISTRRFLLSVFISGSLVTSTLATRDADRLLRIIFWMFAVVVLINAMSVLTTAPTALGHAGIYPHKNYFAAVTSVMMMTALYQLGNGTPVRRLVAAVMLLAAVWFLVVARSKTCTALAVLTPLLAYGAVLLARHGRISPAVSLPAVALVLFGIYAFGAQSGFWDFQAVASAVFGDPTLTQRTDIWAFALKKIEERPWLGFGYEVFWGAGSNSPSLREGPGFVAQMPHAHNGYIDMTLQTGLIGLALFAVPLLSVLHMAGRLAHRAPGVAGFVLSLVVFGALHNCLETSWFRSFNLEAMLFVLAVALVSLREAPSP
jgi:exopolysaccharide production protein ExoQ